MSESDNNVDDSAAEETGGASQEAPNQSVQHQQTGGGTVDNFVTDGEQAIIKEWVLYVTGLFAAFAVSVGLNQIIQEQWEHDLITFSGSGAGSGQSALLNGIFHASSLYTIMMLGLLGSVGVGIVIARAVDNSENTAYKAGVATSIIGLPVLLVVGTFMYTIQLDNWDPEFVNLLVSGLGAGIAASVASVIAIYLTEQQAPSVLD